MSSESAIINKHLRLNNYEILNELKCPVCLYYMVPPIYQCIFGHSICNRCKSMVAFCPQCKGKIKFTRNFSLEAISIKITYPCRYINCSFVSNANKMQAHEAMCKFGPYECPLANGVDVCSWKGDYQMVLPHLEKFHKESLNSNNQCRFTIDIDMGGKRHIAAEIQEVVTFYGQVFKLWFGYIVDKTFFWSVQYIGPVEEVDQYKFSLEIAENGCAILLKSKCSVCNPDFSPDIDITESDVFLTLQQVEKFILNKSTLSFKIEITKQ